VKRRRWLAFLAVGLAASVVTAAVDATVRPLIAVPLTAVALGLGWFRAVRLQRRARGPWLQFCAGGTIMFGAAIVRYVHGEMIDQSGPLPSPADALFLSGYLLFLTAALQFLRARSTQPDRDGWIDAFIAAGAFGVLEWIIVILPYLQRSDELPSRQVLLAAYSLLTIALLAITFRVIHAPGQRQVSYYLLGAAVFSFLMSDFLSTAEYAYGWADDYGLLFTLPTYALFVAALYHPTVGSLTDAPTNQVPQLSLLRAASLAAASIVPPIALLVDVRRNDSPNSVALIISSFLMAVLVTYRLYQLGQVREVMALRAERLRRAGELLIASASDTEVYEAVTDAVSDLTTREIRRIEIVEAFGTEAERVVHACPHAEPRPDQASAVAVAHNRHGSVRLTFGPDLEAYGIRLGPEDESSPWLVIYGERLDQSSVTAIRSLAREAFLAQRAIAATSALAQEAIEKRMEALVRNSSDIYLVASGATLDMTFVSPAVRQLLGHAPDLLLGTSFRQLLHPEDLAGVEAAILRAGVSAQTAEFRLRTAGDEWRWFDGLLTDQLDDGLVAGIVINARESGERRRAQQRLRESEARFKALVQHSSDLVAVLDDEGRFVYISPSSLPLLGLPAEDLVGTSALDFIDPGQREAVLTRVLEHVLDSRVPQHLELQAVSADGHPLILDATITDLRHDPAVGGVVVNARDITVSHKLESDLRFAAYHDSLTGLPNRLLLMKKIEETRQDETIAGIALLFIDLDDFKTINDGLGHAAGDEVLNLVASRVRTVLRLRDTAARLGGDEFAVLLTECYSDADVLTLAERVLAAIAEPIYLDERELHITASIGVAVAWGDHPSPTTMLRDADAAMYKAKQEGKNRAELFESSLQETAIERLELSSDLRRAIDVGELFLVYQPIIDLSTQDLVGLEALVRWEHPTRGVLGPGSFIELAEQTGLIVPVGRWVLDEACRQVAEWDDAGLATPVMSVNMSARQLGDPQLIEDITSSLAEHGVAANRLCIEVTESLLIDETEFTMQRLKDIRTAGVALAVDDFGTGYSSLSYLRRYPFDRLKIDRAFVQSLGESGGTRERDIEIIRAIVDLATRLEVDVVAEGIETETEWKLLQSLGCALGQGFYFSMPVRPAEIGPQLRAGTTQPVETV
jgi:diguanylate cyclase (GGDEF)-like protein/PAS domain S-box-containing protein